MTSSLRALLCGAVALAMASGMARADPIAARPSQGCTLDQIATGRRLAGRIEVGGVAREYIVDVPDTIRPHVPAPLLFDFHGFGHSGAGVWAVSRFRDLAPQAGLITVYPEGLPVRLRLRGEDLERAGWEMYTVDGNRDLAFVRALLDDLERRYCVDRARVFSTGFSNGAFFSALLACTMADRFAAVAPVSGGRLKIDCTPGRAVPILIHHGRLDDLIPIDYAREARDDWLKVDGCAADTKEPDGTACTRWSACRNGAVVEYCEEDVGHTWPPDATARVWEFLQKHPLP
jgi:polyhydroxybutyrate depolymerase